MGNEITKVVFSSGVDSMASSVGLGGSSAKESTSTLDELANISEVVQDQIDEGLQKTKADMAVNRSRKVADDLRDKYKKDLGSGAPGRSTEDTRHKLDKSREVSVNMRKKYQKE